MKHFTPVILTAFSAFLLSLSATSYADNTDSDGFIVFEAQEVEVVEKSPAVAAPKLIQEKRKAKKKVARKAKRSKKAKNKSLKRANKRAKRAKRMVRKKRATRTTRVKRSKSLRRGSSYRVRSGDTLYRISVNSGVKLSRLIRLNRLSGSKQHKIQAGQKIRLR